MGHEQQDRFLTASEVAEMLGCSKSTVWRRAADRTLPSPVKFGYATRWLLTEINSFIEKVKSDRPA